MLHIAVAAVVESTDVEEEESVAMALAAGRRGPAGGSTGNSQRNNRNTFNNSGTGNRTSHDKPLCQVCFKLGHTAADCWHRFDEKIRDMLLQQRPPIRWTATPPRIPCLTLSPERPAPPMESPEMAVAPVRTPEVAGPLHDRRSHRQRWREMDPVWAAPSMLGVPRRRGPRPGLLDLWALRRLPRRLWPAPPSRRPRCRSTQAAH